MFRLLHYRTWRTGSVLLYCRARRTGSLLLYRRTQRALSYLLHHRPRITVSRLLHRWTRGVVSWLLHCLTLRCMSLMLYRRPRRCMSWLLHGLAWRAVSRLLRLRSSVLLTLLLRRIRIIAFLRRSGFCGKISSTQTRGYYGSCNSLKQNLWISFQYHCIPGFCFFNGIPLITWIFLTISFCKKEASDKIRYLLLLVYIVLPHAFYC